MFSMSVRTCHQLLPHFLIHDAPRMMILALEEPPGPPATPTQNRAPPTSPTPTTSPIKWSAPPHIKAPSPYEPDTPSKQKPRKALLITCQHSMSARRTSLQVTSQQELHEDIMDEDGDVTIEANTELVSKTTKHTTALANSMAHINLAEQLMMHSSHSTIHM